MQRRLRLITARIAIVLTWSLSALAQQETHSAQPADEGGNPSASEPEAAKDIRGEIPITAYTFAAAGVSTKSLGAQAYGLTLLARGQDAIAGGGGTIWWAPLERLTLLVDGQRSVSAQFAPSAGAIVRLYGRREEGLSLGALARFKVDGFASGPNRDEMESEIEAGLLMSYAAAGWHLDANAIAGQGTGDDGETDTEGRLRFGRDLGSLLRIGLDGMARLRVAGPRYLPNGRTWDFVAGPQIVLQQASYFGSLTAGPSTVGLLSQSIGWTAMVSVGGATL